MTKKLTDGQLLKRKMARDRDKVPKMVTLRQLCILAEMDAGSVIEHHVHGSSARYILSTSFKRIGVATIGVLFDRRTIRRNGPPLQDGVNFEITAWGRRFVRRAERLGLIQ